MLLGELLHEGVIVTNLKASNKFEAIEELLDTLVSAHEISMTTRDDVYNSIWKREDSMTTGMEHGVAVPHGTTDKVEDVVAALGISPNGIPYDTLDGLPARLILLLVLPRRNFHGHVRTMAGIAHLLANATLRDQLKKASTADHVIKLIETEEDKSGLHGK
ncbi:MAG: PTS transporter subunit IIA [Candidatus Hydrogenedentota bacterium]